ncbi:alpha-L-fucosidase [Nocardiopsis sp. RSe5-2]|uniref:alpha-L-fucosidase n=1 Tax=Nocardiopsis endophytica TaxID=3018445 RepID=A0ABT4U8K0_9ACTN|nr:alpha-L-fucosidase [Nocardiopsis endophytica]MDA2813269.1 alpha-L-fucosidase [Nocardiopsis endophytica]
MTDDSRPGDPAWFDDSKLGVIIHWGAASIPAYAPVRRARVPDPVADGDVFERASNPGWWRTDGDAMMYQNALALPGSAVARHHALHYGDLPYSAFVERFRDATLPAWDPRPWAELFERARAGYVVFCAKGEDGFLLWPSEHPNPRVAGWQSERDAVGDLAAEVRARGMEFGVYYSAWDFATNHPPVRDLDSAFAAVPRDEEYRERFVAHWKELVRRYRPVTLWNDYGVSPPGTDLPALFDWYRSQVPEGLVNDRFDLPAQSSGELHSGYATPEGTTVGPEGRRWQAVWPLSTGYCFNREETDADHISPEALVHALADIVARGGTMLVNVGPTGAGAVPWSQSQRLLALGAWLGEHGEAIRGTRPWTTVHGMTDEGVQTRYTRKGDDLYVIVLGTPRTRTLGLDLRLREGAHVEQVGRPGPLPWSDSPHGVAVELPEAPAPQPAMAVRIGPVGAVEPLGAAPADGGG